MFGSLSLKNPGILRSCVDHPADAQAGIQPWVSDGRCVFTGWVSLLV